MPATSKAQLKFMRAISHGWTPKGGGPTKKQAAEFVAKTKSPGKLPNRAKKGK